MRTAAHQFLHAARPGRARGNNATSNRGEEHQRANRRRAVTIAAIARASSAASPLTTSATARSFAGAPSNGKTYARWQQLHTRSSKSCLACASAISTAPTAAATQHEHEGPNKHVQQQDGKSNTNTKDLMEHAHLSRGRKEATRHLVHRYSGADRNGCGRGISRR